MEPLTKKQKIAAYKYAIKELKKDVFLCSETYPPFDENSFRHSGMCIYLGSYIRSIKDGRTPVSEVLNYFPELKQCKPEIGFNYLYWWPKDEIGATIRIMTLEHCIELLKKQK